MKVLMILGGCAIVVATLVMFGTYGAILAVHMFQAKEENF